MSESKFNGCFWEFGFIGMVKYMLISKDNLTRKLHVLILCYRSEIAKLQNFMNITQNKNELWCREKLKNFSEHKIHFKIGQNSGTSCILNTMSNCNSVECKLFEPLYQQRGRKFFSCKACKIIKLGKLVLIY